MDVRQLRHFLAVAEALHFGRAATRLGMTQPPLSQSILALERALGAPLFLRTKRSVALTAFGEQFLPSVRAALGSVDALAGTARRLREGGAGRLELSFVSTADYSILPALVHRVRERFPEIELALTEATSDVQIATLLDGRGHAGIIIPQADAPLPAPLVYRRLTSEPLIAAVPEIWIHGRRLVPVRDTAPSAMVVASPLVVFPRRAAPLFYDLVVAYYVSRGVQPRIAQHAIQMQTIISLVSAGMGIALIPASLRNMARSGVRYLRLEGAAPTLETGLVWRRNDDSPTLARLLEMVDGLDVAQPGRLD